MAWTEEEIRQHQLKNAVVLSDINTTLQPDPNRVGKVGIFLPGQNGDLITAMSVLHYRQEIFGDKAIIWFANMPNADALRYAPISEVRPWPWAGNGLPEGTPDFWPLLMNENNRLNVEKAKEYELTKDLDDGYFPAPYMLEPQKRHGIDYPNCSRKVFGVHDDAPWFPYLTYEYDEIEKVKKFFAAMPSGKVIFFETFAGSSQSKMSHGLVNRIISICRHVWQDCIFIFTSHKYLREQESFPDGWFDNEGFYSAADFTVRQCGIIAERVDLIISVSSGTTVAASASSIAPIIQYCGSFICSTKSLAANRIFELITADGKDLNAAELEFINALTNLLNKYR